MLIFTAPWPLGPGTTVPFASPSPPVRRYPPAVQQALTTMNITTVSNIYRYDTKGRLNKYLTKLSCSRKCVSKMDQISRSPVMCTCNYSEECKVIRSQYFRYTPTKCTN
jgi:hypothetical protein